MKILVIEDELELQQTIKASLLIEKYIVEVASDFMKHKKKFQFITTTAFY